ncbi:hypothetical protein [Chrysiogenes arsenatis]|uniref:hypothetical protein n=1 Tax=Chrysiogenes arsenatis TaxID=309797 RepID=UPI00040A2C88|nr:hypothetical protein [Chrysiogenes arsenatis]
MSTLPKHTTLPTVIAGYSGGLDSTLAARLMVTLGFRVIAVQFTSPFLGWSKYGEAVRLNQFRRAEALGVELRQIDVTAEHLAMVKSPKFGYGSNVNPCIDCKFLFWEKLSEIMRAEGAVGIVTGDVLGQRPMTQTRHQIERLEKLTGLAGKIIRPLCGRLLPPTDAEQQGYYTHEQLYAFNGRSRKPQIKLAEELGITEYPTPAGGCSLTVPQSAERIKQLLENNWEAFTPENIRLLTVGRHFLLGEGRLVVARNSEECDVLKAQRQADDAFLSLEGGIGTLAIFRGAVTEESRQLAVDIVGYFSPKSRNAGYGVYCDEGDERTLLRPQAIEAAKVQALMLIT